MSVKRDVLEVRERYESLIALARQAAQKPASPLRDRLLTDVMQTLKIVDAALRKADDARRWVLEVFGRQADNAPMTLYLSQTLSRSLIATMGQQTYRLQNFLKGRAVSKAPHPAGMLAASAIAEITR